MADFGVSPACGCCGPAGLRNGGDISHSIDVQLTAGQTYRTLWGFHGRGNRGSGWRIDTNYMMVTFLAASDTAPEEFDFADVNDATLATQHTTSTTVTGFTDELVATVTGTGQGGGTCPSGYTPSSGRCYRLHSTSLSYPAARAQCQSEGADLVIIDNAAENAFVDSLIGSHQVHIGMEDIAVEGAWDWLDGRKSWRRVGTYSFANFGYSNWESGEPNNDGGNQDWGTMLTNGRWNDSSNNKAFVCERGQEGGPEIRKAGGAWATSVVLTPGDTLEVRMFSPATSNSTARATVTLGTVTADWKITTADFTPDVFDFADVINANLNVDYETSATVTGFDGPLTASLGSVYDACPAGYTGNGGSCYRVSANTTDYPTARSQCQAESADLAIINDENENAYVHSLIAGNNAFIGLDDIDVEGTWRWVDGTLARSGTTNYGYSNWETGQPDNSSNQDWGYIIGSNGRWDDRRSGNGNIRYVCERPRAILAQIRKNNTGAWGASVSVNPGDTINVRLRSPSANEQVNTAVVTLGTVSADWKVFTPDPNPDVFDFADVPNAALSTVYIASSVVTGFADTQTATVTGADAQIRNATTGGSWGASAAVLPGETLEVRMTSPSTSGAINTAFVALGNVTADWRLFDEICLTDVPIGTVCSDGSVYGGISSDGNQKVFFTRCDAGMVWDGSSCTGTRTDFPWNDGSTNWLDVPGVPNGDSNNGWIHTATLATADCSSAAGHQDCRAAKYCADLVLHGKSDWYLPSPTDLAVFYNNRNLIGNYTTSRYYKTTHECSSNDAVRRRFNDGDVHP